jgi:putative ABC transport system permease protein
MNTNLKIALRNLSFNKLFSSLNIFGLALGLTVAILLSLFIIQEMSFDDFPNKDRIYRYLSYIKYEGVSETWAGVPNSVGPTVKEKMPEVQLSARTLLNEFGENANITIGDRSFIEKRMYWADPDLLEMFDFQFLSGDRKTALSEPNTIILSASKARQYFGDKDPVNQTITFNRNGILKVTGVYKDLPATTTFDADMIGCFQSSGIAVPTWDNASFETYVMLRDKKDQPKIAAYLPKMLKEHVGAAGTYYTLGMQPLADIHLHAQGVSFFSNRMGDGTRLQQLIYLTIALLLMAAINYMNLATARAQQRSKEVGIRKALGVSRRALMVRFYAETALMTFISVVIGLVLAIVCIPLFNTLSGKTLLYTTLFHPLFCIGLPVLWLSITLVSGLYPALVLSSYKPIEALQKAKQIRSMPVIFRHALVVLQSTASIVLIVGVIIMNVQMKYVSRQKLGYNPENVIAISTNSLRSVGEYDNLQSTLQRLSPTQSVTLAQAFPGKGENSRSLHKDIRDKQGAMMTCNYVKGDDVSKTLQLHMLAGRMVKEWHLSDTTQDGDRKFEIVLNKKALDYLGWTPENAIGRTVAADMGNHTTVVGVVDNFNYSSLHTPVGVYNFNNAPYPIRYMIVRFTTGDLKATLQQYETAFKTVVPNAPFDYTFLDSRLKNLYLADQQTANVLTAFSILAICIGCLGLFGLAAFTAEKRTREIGVRKVLGATVPSLVSLLCRDLVRLVLLAFILACPIAWWGFGHWLDNFAYRISIQWWMFGLAGMVAMVIAIFTVSSQAIRVAIANPVNSLRRE